ncbi:MAG: hypothetical protein ABIR70_24630 [Bryobacteraceae bacterium]
MKYFLLVLFFVWPAFGQSEHGHGEGPFVKNWDTTDTSFESLVWQVDVSGSKATLSLEYKVCSKQPPTSCKVADTRGREIINYIQKVVEKFNSDYADFDRRVDFNAATASTNPQLIALSGYGDNNVSLLDLKTNVKSNTVILPDGMSQTFGVRPVSTGVSREVWTHHFGSTGGQMVITDLAAGRIAGTIPANTTVATSFTAVDIVFSNNGKTAYVISTEQAPDADGNLAGLWIFDADARTLKSKGRLPILQVQSAVMAPDGLTIYLIGRDVRGQEQIAYYDVLSGTADLRALVQEPLVGAVGLFNDLFPLGRPQMHPDGNRLFILHNFQVRAGSIDSAYAVSVFDLAQRKVVNKFPVTFANGGNGRKMELNQDGTRLTILSDKGQIQFMDPISGLVIGGYQAPATTFDIFTTPLIP